MVFIGDIEKLTLENTDYRRVIFTTDKSQLVLMSIPVGEDIELEVHENIDQFFRFEQGFGVIQTTKGNFEVKDGTGVVIPSGTYHRVVNVGDIPLKLYSIYSPPEHPKGRVDKNKPKVNKNNIMKLFYFF